MLGSVHCNNGFSGSCSAKNSCRTGIVFIHDFSLRWMKEHSPLLQRLCHDTTEFFFPFNHNKGLQRQRAFQSICQIFRRFAALFLFFEKLNHLVNRNTFYHPGQCLECITGKAGLFSIELLCISDGSHERNLFFRNSKLNQPFVRESRKQYKVLCCRLHNRCCHDIKYLNSTGLRIDLAFFIPCPIISLIMMVNPQKQINTCLRLSYSNPTVGIIDPYRPDFFIHTAIDLLIVDSRRLRIITELIDKLRNFPLDLPRQCCKCSQEICGYTYLCCCLHLSHLLKRIIYFIRYGKYLPT